jgi:hypothetical protein
MARGDDRAIPAAVPPRPIRQLPGPAAVPAGCRDRTPNLGRNISMTFTDRPTLRINSTNDLLALLPFLLGFPESSLVVVGPAESGIPIAARLTLPAAAEPSGPFDAVLHSAVAELATLPNASVVLVGYAPADQVEPADLRRRAVTPGGWWQLRTGQQREHRTAPGQPDPGEDGGR